MPFRQCLVGGRCLGYLLGSFQIAHGDRDDRISGGTESPAARTPGGPKSGRASVLAKSGISFRGNSKLSIKKGVVKEEPKKKEESIKRRKQAARSGRDKVDAANSSMKNHSMKRSRPKAKSPEQVHEPREKGREKEKEKEMDREREREKEKEKDRERDKEKDRERDKEKEDSRKKDSRKESKKERREEREEKKEEKKTETKREEIPQVETSTTPSTKQTPTSQEPILDKTLGPEGIEEKKPQIFALTSKEKRIAEGQRRARSDYPTMDDVMSDWGEVEEAANKELNKEKEGK